MVESEISRVIRLWAAVAWADGVLAEPEAAGLRRLIQKAELTEAERVAASRTLDGPVTLPESFVEGLSPEARRGIYRAACKMAVVDHILASSERGVLLKLRDLLALPVEVTREIEAEIPGFA